MLALCFLQKFAQCPFLVGESTHDLHTVKFKTVPVKYLEQFQQIISGHTVHDHEFFIKFFCSCVQVVIEFKQSSEDFLQR